MASKLGGRCTRLANDIGRDVPIVFMVAILLPLCYSSRLLISRQPQAFKVVFDGLTLWLRSSDFLVVFSLIDSLPAPPAPCPEREPLANPWKPRSTLVPFGSYKCHAYPTVRRFPIHLPPSHESSAHDFDFYHPICLHALNMHILNDATLREIEATRICFSIAQFRVSGPLWQLVAYTLTDCDPQHFIFFLFPFFLPSHIYRLKEIYARNCSLQNTWVTCNQLATET